MRPFCRKVTVGHKWTKISVRKFSVRRVEVLYARTQSVPEMTEAAQTLVEVLLVALTGLRPSASLIAAGATAVSANSASAASPSVHGELLIKRRSVYGRGRDNVLARRTGADRRLVEMDDRVVRMECGPRARCAHTSW
jgi:hypothetical protein